MCRGVRRDPTAHMKGKQCSRSGRFTFEKDFEKEQDDFVDAPGAMCVVDYHLVFACAGFVA